jgi:protein TonB
VYVTLPAAPAPVPAVILDSLYEFVDPGPRDPSPGPPPDQVSNIDDLGALPVPDSIPIDVPADGVPDARDAWRRMPGPPRRALSGTDDVPPGGVYPAAVVEEAPTLLAGRTLGYPELLRRAGIEGRVIVEAVIDTNGRAEPATIAIVHASHPAFAGPVRDYLRGALFRPGRVHGRAVRVLVRVPVAFTLR